MTRHVSSLFAGLALVVSVAQSSVAAPQSRVALLGAPAGTTNDGNPDIRVSAPSAVSYKYSINGAPYSDERPIQAPVNFNADVLIGTRTFRAGSNELYEFINQRTGTFSTDPLIESVTLNNVESQLQMTYVLNKIRSVVRPENVLNLSGPGVASLDVALREKIVSGNRYELTSLAVTGGTLFADTSLDSTKHFRLALARNAISLVLTAATNNIQTTITVNGQHVTSGAPVPVYPTTGSSILLQATGPDGSHVNYQIDISYDDSLARTEYRSYYLRAFNPSSAYVSIRNSGVDVVAYGMTFNNTLGLTRAGIIHEIAAMSAEFPDEPMQHRVWRFIRDNRYHFVPLTGATWFSSVALFFNSAGFGFCDDSAALFYQLMTTMGYPARVWGLNGHVVPEVFVNNRWELWDPDLEVYYLNGQGLVAGVEELASNPALITSPINPILTPAAFPYQQVVADIYSSRSDNFLYPPDPMTDSSTIMAIPPGATFEFPDLYETPLDAMAQYQVPSYANARLVIPAGFSGRVSMPLIIHSIGWSNHPTLSVVTKDGAGNWDSVPTTANWAVDLASPVTTASQASGSYNPDEPVTLTTNEPATIYYSMDGPPTLGSWVYTVPVRILPGGFVQFFAVDQAGNREQVRAYGPTVGQASLTMSSLAATTVTFSGAASGGVGSYEFNFRMYDPNAGWLTVQAYSESDNWIWNRAGAAAGRYTVELLARNRGTTEQFSTSAVLAFNVGQNAAPVLPNPGDQTSAENANISLQLAASDPDGDRLTYGVLGLPTSLSVNPASGVITGTLSLTSAGRYVVTAVVSDGSLSASQAFTWTVGNTNRAPILTNPGDQTNSDSPNYRQAVVADGPAAYWRLDDTTGTSVASSAGTDPGSLFGGVTLGQRGGLADGGPAMLFDGSTGYVQVANSAAVQLAGDLTIEMWVNVSLATRQTLISKGYLYEFELTLETSGHLNFYQGDGTIYENVASVSGAVAANVWQHVVVTRVAATKTVRFYVNGVAKGSGFYFLTPTSGPKAVSIGRSATNQGMQYANGRLDDVALYPAALSPAQIATHYALGAGNNRYAQAVATDTPAAYWRLDETTGTTVASSAGTDPGTLFGGVTLGQPGLADGGPAMLFDGSTGYVQVANSAAVQLAGDLTIEMWVNVSLATRQTLISKGYLYEFELTLETSGHLNFYQGDGTIYENVASVSGAVGANVWQHVVVTRVAATKTVRFYVNGVAKGSGFYFLTPTSGPKAVSIGRSATNQGMQYANGRLDDVALYPAALSPARIATHYALRTVDARGSSVALQLSANDPDGDALTYSTTALPPGLAVNPATGLVSGTLAPTSAGAYQVTATASDGSASTSRTFTWTITHVDGGS